MSFVREFVEYKPWGACRILVVVDDNGNSEVQECLENIKDTHPKDYKKMVVLLKKAALIGPRSIHDEKLCRLVGDVGELKVRGSLLRIFWFFGNSVIINNRRVDTIILTHAALPNKGSEQSRKINRAERIAAQYNESPFEEIEA